MIFRLCEEDVSKVRFNVGDSIVDMKSVYSSTVTTQMCSSSLSEEDSGFVSSETVPHKDNVNIQIQIICNILFCDF